MASVPGVPAAGRTRSFDGVTPASPEGRSTLQESTSSNDSTEVMEDTETVFLNKDISTPSHGSMISTKSLSESSKSAQVSDDDEPRKCWICYTDETEDSPLNLEWRSPCPCALTAHEACLLDWLADMENPRSRRTNGGATMTCPQCKTEIVVTRPRSYMVDGLRLVERAAGRLVLPGMMFTVAGTLWAGCLVHGVYSMQIVFGSEEATVLLDELLDGPWSPSMAVGLPLIPLVLIFSRTRYGSGLLPAIPILFFTSHHPGQTSSELWPPTPAMAFSTLPYIKCFYGLVYDRLFGRLEQKWIAEVQPRAAEEILDDAQQQDMAEGLNRFDDDGNGNFLMEIDLQLQMGLGDEDEDGALPAGQNGNAEGVAANEQAQDADQNNAAGLGRRHHEIINDTSNLADVVLGALVFPAVAASMGGLLKYALPAAWTTPAPQSKISSLFGRGRAGLLQTRWGRSIVGGCMFVLLKDALVLYCRWKLAQTHRRRKVLNYDQSKKRQGKKRPTE